MKFFPAYRLAVETSLPDGAGPGNVAIELPISCEFEIRRANLSSAGAATFRLFNLGAQKRDLIQHDFPWVNLNEIRALQFSAGYEKTPSTMIFNGYVKQAQSMKRPGGTEWITTIEGLDGGAAIANGFSLRSFAGGTLYTDLIKNLAKDLPGIAKSAFIGAIKGQTARGSAFTGNTWNYIFQLSNGLAFIDNSQLKILAPNEYAGTTVPKITSESGLLGTPERFLNMLRVTLLFEPNVAIGQLVELETLGVKKFNGLYKVVGIVHRGTISQARDGERRTELTLWNGLATSDSWTPVAETSIG